MNKIFKFDFFKFTYLSEAKERELAVIRKDFNISDIHFYELRKPSSRGKLEIHPDYILFIMEFPIYSAFEQTVYPKELDIILKKDEVLALSYENFPPIDEFLISLKNENKSITLMEFLNKFIKNNLQFLFRELEHIKNDIDKINKDLINPNTKTVETISLIKRDILDFIKIIEPQKINFDQFLLELNSFYRVEEKSYFEYLRTIFNEVSIYINNYKGIVDSAETTVQNILTLKTNEIIKVLTVISVFIFPLTLITSIFSMNAKTTPLIGMSNGFWIIIGIMAFFSLAMLYYFKKKKFF